MIFIYLFIYFPLQNITQNTLGIPPLPLPHFPKKEKRGKKKPPSCHTCGLFFSLLPEQMISIDTWWVPVKMGAANEDKWTVDEVVQ